MKSIVIKAVFVDRAGQRHLLDEEKLKLINDINEKKKDLRYICSDDCVSVLNHNNTLEDEILTSIVKRFAGQIKDKALEGTWGLSLLCQLVFNKHCYAPTRDFPEDADWYFSENAYNEYLSSISEFSGETIHALVCKYIISMYYIELMIVTSKYENRMTVIEHRKNTSLSKSASKARHFRYINLIKAKADKLKAKIDNYNKTP